MPGGAPSRYTESANDPKGSPMYDKILVPVDDGEENRRAVEHAAALRKLSGGRVCLLHVVDPLWYANGRECAAIYFNTVLPAMRRDGRRILQEFQDVLGGDAASAEQVLEEAGIRSVPEIIIGQAKQWGADVIVMGTHGRRGWNRTLMGSVAEEVARLSPVPVMLVRPATPRQP